LGIAPDINVYSSSPVSNIALEAGDFDSLGSIAYCDSAITYDSWVTDDYNDFTLNAAGIAAVSKTAVSKFGLRNANYDVAETPPSWLSFSASAFGHWCAEKGEGFQPKLVVVYEEAPPPPPSPPSMPTGLILTALSDTEINATWDAVSGDNITYLLLVSIEAYPDSPTGDYDVAYSGNATSVDLTGYELAFITYYFSLWSHSNPYSTSYATAEIGAEGVADEIANLASIIQRLAWLLPLVVLSALAFWKENVALFMITGGIAMMTGLYSPDIFSQSTTNLGITVGLALMAYCFLCFAWAFRLIFWRESE